jgi:hypothetical protein
MLLLFAFYCYLHFIVVCVLLFAFYCCLRFIVACVLLLFAFYCCLRFIVVRVLLLFAACSKLCCCLRFVAFDRSHTGLFDFEHMCVRFFMYVQNIDRMMSLAEMCENWLEGVLQYCCW